MCYVFVACIARYSELLAYIVTAVWTFGTPPKPRNFFGRKGIFAESHRSIFSRKRNFPKQFKLLSSAPKPKPNFGRSLQLGNKKVNKITIIDNILYETSINIHNKDCWSIIICSNSTLSTCLCDVWARQSQRFQKSDSKIKVSNDCWSGFCADGKNIRIGALSR